MAVSAGQGQALAGLVQAQGSAALDRAQYPTEAECCAPTQKDRSCGSCTPILRSQTLMRAGSRIGWSHGGNQGT